MDENVDIEKVTDAHFMLFAGYLELVHRRLRLMAMTNGFYGTTLPEGELREALGNICAKLKYELRLTDEMHNYLQGALYSKVFGATKSYFVVNKK